MQKKFTCHSDSSQYAVDETIYTFEHDLIEQATNLNKIPFYK